ncbi:MAG: ankyrin repeat domain-containing protein [Rhodospirillales bacterium]|nr:ankyrin repeat domain-containing protein [Rhodospirillales bacterium]
MSGFCRLRWGIIAGVTAIALCAVAARADYETGLAAWDAGRHAEGVTAWQEAARANDSRAMLALGRAFVAGVGVPQDYVEAHKWLNLAAGLGDGAAAAERDALSAEMTAEERAEARKLARAWRTAGDPSVTDARPPDTPEAIAATPSPAAPPERALREAQKLLATLGYAPGPADGQWGRRSIEAYRSFLGDAGMDPSDVLTPEALRAMRELARDAERVAEVAALPPDAVHRAVQAGDQDALAAALAAGADVDGLDERGWTALMHAANRGYPLLVAPLLEAGAGLDSRAPDGATALFMATAQGHSEVIAQLMEAGADVTVPGPKGKTAVDIARVRYGDVDTAREDGERPLVLALLRGSTLLKEARDLGAERNESGTAVTRARAGAAFRTRVAEWLKRCWELRRDPDLASFGLDLMERPEEMVASLEAIGSPIAGVARKYANACIPVARRMRASGVGERCFSLHREIYSVTGDAVWTLLLDGNKLNRSRTAGAGGKVDEYLRTCVPLYAAAIDG